VRPFHSMSRGSPTFTDSSRAMALRTLVDRKPSRLESSYRRAHATAHDLTRQLPDPPPTGSRHR